MQLLVGRRQKFGRCGVHLRRSLSHPGHRALHVTYQRAQFLDRVIHRVGNGTSDVLGHGGFLGQVALRHRLQLIHQSQNGRLIGIVHALGFLLLTLCILQLVISRGLALATVKQLNTRQSNRAQQGKQSRACQGCKCSGTQTGA